MAVSKAPSFVCVSIVAHSLMQRWEVEQQDQQRPEPLRGIDSASVAA
jgi:hypothetical protein